MVYFKTHGLGCNFWETQYPIGPPFPILKGRSRKFARDYIFYLIKAQMQPIDHPYKRRRRYTLKADEYLNFQPQLDSEGELVDILPLLLKHGFTLQQLQSLFNSGRGSKPIPLVDRTIVMALYDAIEKMSKNKLYGVELERIRLMHP